VVKVLVLSFTFGNFGDFGNPFVSFVVKVLVGLYMRRYVILTNRKRAIIALVHTVAFLALAVATGAITVQSLHAGSRASAWIVASIFLLVTIALLALTVISGPLRERLYFACCTTSAGFGLARQLLGDQHLPVAVYVRVAMLACAVFLGVVILREHSAPVPAP